MTIQWAADWFGYAHGSDYIRQLVNATPNSAAMPPFAGNWTLGEIKSVQAAQAKLDEAVHALRAKLGNDWALDIDWVNFDLHSKDHGARSNVGDFVIVKLALGFATNDVAKIDGDVAEALNDAVGTTKKVTLSLGSKTGTYDISSRLNIKVDKTSGVSLTWSGDWVSVVACCCLLVEKNHSSHFVAIRRHSSPFRSRTNTAPTTSTSGR